MIYILNKGGGTAKKKKKCSEDKWENLSVRPRKEKKKKNDSRWKEQLGARFTRVITS